MLDTFSVPVEQLYFKVDEKLLGFNTTKDVKPDCKMFGHDVAKQALSFAIECPAKGFNAYVRGLSGTGRKTLVRQVLNEIKPKARQRHDYCYIHNFSHPSVPRLVILPNGYGKRLKQRMSAFSDYVVNDLPKVINGEEIKQKRAEIDKANQKVLDKLYKPFERKIKKASLALATMQVGDESHTVVAPVYEGEVLSPEQVSQLVDENKFPDKLVNVIEKKLPKYQEELQKLNAKAVEIVEKHYAATREIEREFAKSHIDAKLFDISKQFKKAEIDAYLAEIVEDFLENVLHSKDNNASHVKYYGVNILSAARTGDEAPVIFESSPTLQNLLGAAETQGDLPAYACVSSGSLLRADGGFLVLEVDEALSEGGVWSTLMRVIRTGELSFSFEDYSSGRPTLIKPEAMPLDVKVILIGSPRRFYELGAYDGDFADNFKILVDLDAELLRQQESYLQYANVIRKTIDEEGLKHFKKGAVAQLIEEGIRQSSGKNKLSARFGRMMDIAREANYLAVKSKAKLVGRSHVVAAIRAAKLRGYAPVRRFSELQETGTIIIETQGQRVGQINGLAVTQAGTVSYGFPARITATVSPGKAGLINIEGQSDLSGNIHTKGFQILGGLLRHLIKPQHPLSFSASIAFEQSYGGIDGDSASGAEACCLLSAITQTPIQQNLSMTGAIDQFGNLQAIGGVNEKIEGFYDCCQLDELTGDQGVIIPAVNVSDLMLRSDVVEACKQGQFHIYAVDHVLDALAILTGTESCKSELLQCSPYRTDSILASAVKQSEKLFQQSEV